jgi:hypothetical protein
VVGNVKELLDRYFVRYQIEDEAMEILEVEKTYEVQVGDDFYMKIIVDLVARIPGIGIAVMDHKFVYDFYNASVVDLAPQLPKYLAVVNSVGINAEHAFYNEIRYRTTQENKAQPYLRFSRPKVTITPTRIKTTMEEQLRAAKKVQYLRSLGLEEWEKRVLRAANSMICDRCPFQNICALDLNGQDTTLAIEYDYVRRDKDRNG